MAGFACGFLGFLFLWNQVLKGSPVQPSLQLHIALEAQGGTSNPPGFQHFKVALQRL